MITEQIEKEELQSLLLQYKKTYLEMKKFLILCEFQAIDDKNSEKVKECEEQLIELDEIYQQTISKFEKKLQ